MGIEMPVGPSFAFFLEGEKKKETINNFLKEKPCDICGALGYGELIVTCINCGVAREHVYCKQVFDQEVPEVWICEDCITEKGRCGGKDNFQDSSNIVNNDMVTQGGSTKFYDDLGRHRHSKRQKPVETGKVKFLPTEEVIRLSSGAAKRTSSLKSNLGYRPSSSVTPKFSPVKLNPNPRIISSGLMKPPGHGRIQIDSLTGQQGPIISKEQKPTTIPMKEHSCKATIRPVKESSCLEQKITSIKPGEEVKTCNANLLAKEVRDCNSSVIAKEVNTCNANAQEVVDKQLGTSSTSTHDTSIMGSDSCPVAEFKKSDAEVRGSTSLLPKLSLHHSYFPALRATWKGGFKFFDTTKPGKFYGGFQAQPPCIVNRKAYNLSQTMPTILQVELLPRHHVWEDLFQNDYPDCHDIALYFLPSAITERSKDNCASLFKLMEIQNSVIRSCINDVELIVFTSKLLHRNLQGVIEKSSTEQFLWGVFRHAKSHKIPLEPHFASMECCETDDMEIEMEGGQALGRVDMVVTKELYHLQSSAGKLSDTADEVEIIPPGLEDLSRRKLRNLSFKARYIEEPQMGNFGPRGAKGDGYSQFRPMESKIEAHKFGFDQLNFSRKLSTKLPVETYRAACWSPPPTNWVKLNVAGKSKGSSGVAGASGIIRNESGKWVVGYTLNLHSQTSSGAELCALFQGLLIAWNRGFRKILVEVEEYLKRATATLDPNRALIDCCMNLIKRDWDCKILQVRREANLCANWLATHFEDHPLGLTIFESPPGNLVPILQKDSMRSPYPSHQA
ncbi:uncharacterized protein LOC110636243 isoform X1 [Hevea brasiliensis]|uniref:uncharacterized protein LOC110636243 isoform X1 n=2 Tax=Hevea brasiliensis TaxID=3981 RepID=UPI0025F8F26E|nr:uncharacterized protein LOC110636243 isoform X1 [Hevea brasiliensis]